MLTIKAINNNADSIRVINHGTKFNKTDVLMYAEHIIQTKYARIFKYPARAYASYKIAGGRAAIRHKIPARREHLLTIEQMTPAGYDDILFDEYYNDIIVTNWEYYRTQTINNGRYAALYDNIVKYVRESDELYYALEDVKNNVRDREYKTMRAAILDYLNIEVTTKQAGKIRAIANKATSAHYLNYYDEDDRAADLLTVLTPHKWEAVTLRGCCQGDAVRAIYPADVYSDADISEYECYYFGLYSNYCATYKNESVWYTYTDNTPTAEIIDNIRADYSTNNIRYCPAY